MGRGSRCMTRGYPYFNEGKVLAVGLAGTGCACGSGLG